jgi:hypothetical protein
MKQEEIKEMAASAGAVFIVVFFATLPLIGLTESTKLALAYVFVFHLPFLPLAYSFRELNLVERIMFSNIFGICYTGLYAVLDFFFRIKLFLATYVIVTVLLFLLSFWIYSRKR